MRSLPLLLVLLIGCADPPDPEALRGEGEARALAGLRAALEETARRVEPLARSVDRTLSPLPVMTPGEEAELRSRLNAQHVARARALGVRVGDEEERDSLVAAGRLVQLEDSTEHWIVRPGTSPAYVVPHVRSLLRELGERFQGRLAELDLPPYRLEVTSALRTSGRQARLATRNANAAALSSHEFGTTVDLSYAAYAPPADLSALVPPDAPAALAPHLLRYAALALESASARKSRELTRIFGDVLREAQREGLVLVIYERQQTVFHLTVGRSLADG